MRRTLCAISVRSFQPCKEKFGVDEKLNWRLLNPRGNYNPVLFCGMEQINNDWTVVVMLNAKEAAASVLTRQKHPLTTGEVVSCASSTRGLVINLSHLSVWCQLHWRSVLSPLLSLCPRVHVLCAPTRSLSAGLAVEPLIGAAPWSAGHADDGRWRSRVGAAQPLRACWQVTVLFKTLSSGYSFQNKPILLHLYWSRGEKWVVSTPKRAHIEYKQWIIILYS